MPNIRRLPAGLVYASLAVSLPAQGCHDLTAVTAIAGELLAAAPLQGSSCIGVEQRGDELYRQAFGTFGLGEVVPIASASKTLSAAVLLSLVDDGTLALDDRVGQYLPEWNSGLRASITLRMCFTHTAGLPANHAAVGDGAITLRQAAQAIASAPLLAIPGSQFRYGGVSMHVAGAVCEVASGQPWSTLFAQRVAAPLGMVATDFEAFGTTQNPRIAGGARSCLDDYAAFVGMLREQGTWQGQQVLSAASVAAMLSDQTSGLPVAATPHPESAPYGIGIWLDRRDAAGRTLLASGVGAFGFAGFVDLAHDASGVFVVDYLNQVTWPYLRRLYDALDDALLPVGLDCVGLASPACAAGGWINADRPAVAREPEFALLASRVPADSIGAFLLGAPQPLGVPFADLLAYVGPVEVVAGVVADASGRARLAAPLPAGLSGATLAVQALWLSASPCTAMGLAASHGMSIQVP